MLVVDQAEGETIFVPSGYYHQVINLTDCISINHNWANSTNIVSMYKAMCNHAEDVEVALSDVKELLSTKGGEWQFEWVECVQNVLRGDSGWE